MFSIGSGLMFSIVPVFVGIIFIIVFGTIIMTSIRGLSQWNRNNHSPILTVGARVVAKRTDVSYHRHHHGNDMSMHHSYSTTTYFATFEFESGDRLELAIPAQDFGYLVEGDYGRLTFQGTRFKEFIRGQGI